MIKLLHLEITDFCERCPYCRFDNEWGDYDCWNEDCPKNPKHPGSLAHLDRNQSNSHIPIPDWCPLPGYRDGGRF